VHAVLWPTFASDLQLHALVVKNSQLFKDSTALTAAASTTHYCNAATLTRQLMLLLLHHYCNCHCHSHQTQVDQPTTHILGHANNRVQRARAAGHKEFVWAVQIMVPGPPHFAFVAYFTPRDGACIEADTPFGRLVVCYYDQYHCC
jgi:Protein ENHANCED DISEASE RESISTANCE 2, C-terminal